MAERILLIGMMGAGKTTVGRELAQRLGWSYCDSDAQVEARTGRTVREIFESDGEAAFRCEEARALAEAAAVPKAVISVAGGAVLAAGNRAIIADAGTVVWLKAPVETLALRVSEGSHRPLLRNDPLAVLRQLNVEREPLYAGLADLTVDATRSPAEIVDTIVEAIS